MTTDAALDAVLAEMDPAALPPDFVDTAYLDREETPKASTPQPPPGSYFLQFGVVTGKLVPGRSGENERGPWTIPAKVEVLPSLSIVSDAEGDTTFAGALLNKYYRLTTEPVRFKGETRNFSTLSAAMKLFGLDLPRTGSADDIIAAASALSGLVTPKPIAVTLNGVVGYKPYFVGTDGRRVYLGEKMFRTGDREPSLADYKAGGGTWARLGYILDPDTNPVWTLEPQSENTNAKRVFANLEPTEFGWKPR